MACNLGILDLCMATSTGCNRTVNISLVIGIFNKLKYVYTYELAMDYIIIVLK